MIDSEVFYNYAELKTVILPKSVVFIGESTFYGCKKLKNITLGNVEIGAAAFKGIRKKAHFHVQCEESEFDEVKAQIKGSGAKKPQIERVSM